MARIDFSDKCNFLISSVRKFRKYVVRIDFSFLIFVEIDDFERGRKRPVAFDWS